MPNNFSKEIFIDVEPDMSPSKKKERSGLIGFLHKMFTKKFEGSIENYRDMLSFNILLYMLFIVFMESLDLNDDEDQNLANFHAFINILLIQANNNDEDSGYGTE